MSSVKPRGKVPKKASIDEVIEIKTLIRHPMHSGRMKDKDGKIIPRQIINAFKVEFEGKVVSVMIPEGVKEGEIFEVGLMSPKTKIKKTSGHIPNTKRISLYFHYTRIIHIRMSVRKYAQNDQNQDISILNI